MGLILGGLRGLNGKFSNGTVFVEEFWAFSKMVPFLLAEFGPFLKWYNFNPPFYQFQRSKGVTFEGV